jgi:predicted short-subunit dehydrogenase-like oxidoreductase (DUF2520 family)
MSILISNNIILIGAGNAASHIGLALYNAGYKITQVYSRTKKSAAALAKKTNAEAINDLKKLDLTASIYIIAVKDDAIAEVASQLKLKDKIVVHTSGTASIDVLQNVSKNYGVFYPLQTFSKNKAIDFRAVPICIEANNRSTASSLEYFAKSISSSVQKVNSDQRKIIHLAAVFACNFTNHMYAIAEDILVNNKLSLDVLKPLIEETANKIKSNSPLAMQTGPAIRGDKKTMDAHLKLLSGNKKLKEIYKLMSESISKTK